MNERLKWWGKQAGIGAGWMVVGALLTALTLFVAIQTGGPELGPWRTEPLDGEFSHRNADEIESFDRYVELEVRLFQRLEQRLAEEGRRTGPLDRYNPDSPTCSRRFEPDGNRTFEIEPSPEIQSRGAALLLHGLSDSPYSVRSVGELLAGEGFEAIGMRLPGHGTLPAALREVSFKDWRAATRIGAVEAAERAGPSGKLILVGYSNGAALALDYTVAALDDPALPVPDALIFLSPAFAVTRMAGLARFQRWMSELPGLDKLAYNSTLPEYDPYKYNSFPIQAAEQIYRLTNRLEQGLARLKESGRIGELPPALALQSAVDATVPPISSLTRLYGRLEEGGSQIVLFDVNRLAQIESLLAPHVDELFDEVRQRRPRPFDITVVTNVSADSREVLARTWPAGSTTADEQILDMIWPSGIYSLSHVAIPFPVDDSIYGAVPAKLPLSSHWPQPGLEPDDEPFPFGTFELRGERGALLAPPSLFMRLRYNPFHAYLEARISRFVSENQDDPSRLSATADSD